VPSLSATLSSGTATHEAAYRCNHNERTVPLKASNPILTWGAENRKIPCEPVAHRSPLKTPIYNQALMSDLQKPAELRGD
jgi:hypothetical protein